MPTGSADPLKNAPIGTAPRVSLAATTHGRANLVNPMDGTDGSRLLAIVATVALPTATVHTTLPLGSGTSVVVSSGGTRGPPRRNYNFVKAPTGDIGLSPTGGAAVGSGPVTKRLTPSSLTRTAHAREMTSDTT